MFSYSQVNEKLVLVDNTIERLLQGLQDQGIINCVNLILLADHGGATAGYDKLIRLSDYMENIYDHAFFFGGAFSRIDLKDENDEGGNL